jgi:hypothetical protein
MSEPLSARASDWVLSTEDGSFRWRRARGQVLAEWVGILTLRIDETGNVSHEASPGADARLVEKLVHTGAAAFVRALRDQPSLHASAVAGSGRALVCLGDKGSGKSTAAWELCRTRQLELLADDVTGLERCDGRWCALPTESSHWLRENGPGPKGPMPALRAANHPAELSCLVALRFEDGLRSPVSRRLRGADAYAALSSALLRFEAADGLRVRELDLLSSLATQARVYELVRPRSCGVGETADQLVQLMEGAP